MTIKIELVLGIGFLVMWLAITFGYNPSRFELIFAYLCCASLLINKGLEGDSN